MELTITESAGALAVQSTLSTAVEPGQPFTLAMNLLCETPVNVRTIDLDLPDHIDLVANPLPELLPVELQPGQPLALELGFQTSAANETFGRIRSSVTFDSEAQPNAAQTLAIENWISVLARAVARYPEPLPDALVARLKGVTNDYLRNAFLFVADFVAYFDDYLNIEIPADAVAGITEMLPFATDGLPLDADTRLAIAQGRTTLYGITAWQFEDEDDCEEFDDVFQPSGVTDVDPTEVEV